MFLFKEGSAEGVSSRFIIVQRNYYHVPRVGEANKAKGVIAFLIGCE